jgi:hypothetical protein
MTTPHEFENLGGKPRLEDPRDFVVEGSAIQYPSVFTQDTAWGAPIYYQGKRPACGAHAGVWAKTLLDINDGKKAYYTPHFTWIDLKQNAPDTNPSDGVDTRSIGQSLKNTGVNDFEPLENNVTYDDLDYANPSFITNPMRTNASTNKTASYSFAKPTFEGLKSLIYENKAVILLVQVGKEFWTAPNGTTSWQEADVLPLRTPSSIVSAHFIVAHSYDDKYIYFANSWSTDWGRKGHGYFGADYMTHVVEAMIPVNAAPVQPDLPPIPAVQDASKLNPVQKKSYIDSIILALIARLKLLITLKSQGGEGVQFKGMNKLQISLGSPAAYTTLALVLVNTLTPILSILHGTPLIIVDVILGAATAYLAAMHVQIAAQTGSTKIVS